MEVVFDLLIRNGMVVQEDRVERLDVGIKDGTIIAMGYNLFGGATEVIDASYLHLFPGMIDVHVHFSEPGRAEWEGFEHGSKAAAAGGITTFFDMPLNGIPSTTSVEALLDKKKYGEEKSVVDFELWGGLVPGNIDELEGMAQQGVIGFKAFLSPTGTDEFEAVDDVTLYRGMEKIAKLGKILALHSENGFIVEKLKMEKLSQGLVSSDDYVESRPILAEVEAVSRALLYGRETGCSLHFVHISSEKAVNLIEEAKAEGQDVSVETCPHYLLLNQDDFRELGAEAKCAPPLRDKQEQDRLWERLKAGHFDMISSDHSPCPTEMKQETENMFNAWGGITGVQFSYVGMIDHGYYLHGLSLPTIANLLATNPAKRFGFYPKKGSIQLGADADLALIDLKETWTVKEGDLYSRHRHSAYVNRTFQSRVVRTISRGRVVFG